MSLAQNFVRKSVSSGQRKVLSEICLRLRLQQMRKLLLEIIHRIPISEQFKPYTNSILKLMFKLVEVSVCV